MNRVRVLLGAAICFGLVACGGGGGPPGPPPPPPPPPRPSAADEFPDTIAVTFPELTTLIERDTSFPMWAPTDEAPTDVGTIGADARFFRTIIMAGTPNAAGIRTVTVRIEALNQLSANVPQDENGDGVYRYTIQGRFRGETISAEISVTFADIFAKATVIEGEQINQLFGGPVLSVPDVTGDGRPEMAASIQSGIGSTSGYLVGSEFFAAMPTGRLNISTLGNAGSKFLQPASTPAQSNVITSLPAAAGVDVMVSDAMRNKLYLYPGVTPATYGSLRGASDPDLSADAIVYSFPGGSPAQQGVLIGDVNGDNRNDILVRNVAPGGGRFGIIFGRALSSPSDRFRTASFDIELNYAPDNSTGVTTYATRMISDVDGDTHPELVISMPQGSTRIGTMQSTAQQGRFWLIRSSVLRAAGPTVVNLETLAAPQGLRLTNTEVGSIIEFVDLDNDGYKTLLIGSLQRIYAIDGNDLLQAQATTFGPTAVPIIGSILLGDAGDIDGDGLKEIMLPTTARSVHVVRGSTLRSMITNPVGGPTAVFPAGSTLDFTAVIPYTSPSMRSLMALGPTGAGQGGLIAVGSWCDSSCPFTVSGSSGQIALVKADDIRDALTASAARIEIRRD